MLYDTFKNSFHAAQPLNLIFLIWMLYHLILIISMNCVPLYLCYYCVIILVIALHQRIMLQLYNRIKQCIILVNSAKLYL